MLALTMKQTLGLREFWIYAKRYPLSIQTLPSMTGFLDQNELCILSC